MQQPSLCERQLLLSAKSGDLAAIVNIMRDMTTEEKAALRTSVLDTVVDSIADYAKHDPVESAYTMMMLVRSVGTYIPPASMSHVLKTIPIAQQATRPSATERRQPALFLPRSHATV